MLLHQPYFKYIERERKNINAHQFSGKKAKQFRNLTLKSNPSSSSPESLFTICNQQKMPMLIY
ncbi:hypothetical protein DERF_014501 [Dermatophagoides farinae]|uniref:Uncharacterized protein n=1 Tax=Dermatophagoides farinae TaxID=6954 RepID=A0A922HM71_DERFA|nr:hypothetical protein DERF_014501 [Dermatophagoides farinae]